jgi:hypothetical protein
MTWIESDGEEWKGGEAESHWLDESASSIERVARVGKLKRVGGVVAECPECKESGRVRETPPLRDGEHMFGLCTVDTRYASSVSEIGDGLRWIDVPCFECGSLYTIEMSALPDSPETGT